MHEMQKMCEAMMSHGSGAAAGSGTTGALMAAAGFAAGRGLLGRVIGHPVVLLGLGIAAGYYAHKYRKEIVAAANKASDYTKDFVLNQKEKLTDLIEEGREAAEAAGKPAGPAEPGN